MSQSQKVQTAALYPQVCEKIKQNFEGEFNFSVLKMIKYKKN